MNGYMARLAALLLVGVAMPLQAQSARDDLSSTNAVRAGAPTNPKARLAHHEKALTTDPADYAALRGAAESALAAGMMAESDDEKREYFAQAVDYAKRMRLLRGDDVDARYWHAVSRGMLVDFEPLKERVRIGQEVYEEAAAIVEKQPDHAGAHHILGRAHGAIMRLPGPARFVAGKILGGIMEDASWEAAQHHFEVASAADPGSLAHRYELAAVYRDSDRADEALAIFERVVDMTVQRPLDAPYVEKAREQVEEMK